MTPKGSPLIEFIVTNIRWLFAGLFLTFLSSFGQTFFIAMFGSEIRAAFNLSNGDFGTLYMFGTLASAFTLIWLGQLADHMRVRVLGAITIVGLAIACVVMASTIGYLSLLLAIYLLRLTGQGMLSHISVTAMGRWFDAYRGRAIAISVLGYPVGEAIFPTIAVMLTLRIGWQNTWLVMATVLVAIGLPLFLLVLRQRRIPGQSKTQAVAEPPNADRPGMVHWTRGEAMSHALLWFLVPSVMTPAFIVTATFFHQSYLVETKGWSLAFWAACYPGYAIASIASSALTGWSVDRWSGRQTLPFLCFPIGLAMLVLAYGTTPWIAVVTMVLLGLSAGSTTTILGSLWPELYGTRHLGSIKALATAGMVFSSALGPGVMGKLIDAGVSLDRQFIAMAAYCFAVCALGVMLQTKMKQTQPELAH